MRICNACGLDKYESAFYKRSKSKDGIDRRCKVCRNSEVAKWRLNNLERNAKNSREWAIKNPEKIAESAKISAKKHSEKNVRRAVEWALNNPDRRRANARNWIANNPEKVNANTAKYKSAKRNANAAWGIDFIISEAYHLAKLREKVCGGKWEVDHIVPLRGATVCGLHVHNNLRVIRKEQNMSKGNRYWPDMP